MSKGAAGDKDAEPATVEALLKRVDAKHPLRPDLLCRRAYHLAALKDPVAPDLAREACESGKECCDFEP